MIISDEITMIKDCILSSVDTEKIFLFGSFAYGNPNKDSDYDLFVVIPDGGMRPIDAMQKINRTLAHKNIMKPIDVLASYSSNFYERCKSLSFESKIANEGVTLYERN